MHRSVQMRRRKTEMKTENTLYINNNYAGNIKIKERRVNVCVRVYVYERESQREKAHETRGPVSAMMGEARTPWPS